MLEEGIGLSPAVAASVDRAVDAVLDLVGAGTGPAPGAGATGAPAHATPGGAGGRAPAGADDTRR